MRSSLAALVAAVLLPLACMPSAATAAERDTTVINVPIEDGRIELRDVLEAVFDAAGLEAGERLETVDVTIDVGSTLGRMKLYILDRIVPGAVDFEVTDEALIVTIDRAAIRAHGAAVLDRLERGATERVAPAPDPQRFGLSVVTLEDPRASIDQLPVETDQVVVLVHGLDDPGFMWDDLAPTLLSAGHTVLRFEYPNDQPITDSTDLLAEHVRRLRDRGVERISIVAHSMGGLVARDLLTRTAYYGGDGRGDDRYPQVDHLIMLGPPNHGAPMARLRGLAEAREIIVRWTRGERGLLDAIADGAGEAARDLLPASDFLRRLNARPRPGHTKLTIVAGRVAPFSREELDRAVEGWPSREGSDNAGVKRMAGWLDTLSRGLGDGVVSIGSTRLEGVDDFTIVESNHLSMILEFGAGDDAPAIPIVVDRLGELRMGR